LAIPEVAAVIVAINPDHRAFCDHALSSNHIADERLTIVDGGTERQHSIRAALTHPAIGPSTLVFVHDAVRPFATFDLYRRVGLAALLHGAAVPALPVRDTVKMVLPDEVVEATLPRTALRAVQTPQCFRADILRTAYDHAADTGFVGTDDASLVEAAGAPVYCVEGDERNIKVTTPLDLVIAEAFLAA
jgi:2-C-methyl-D-erythritol 4-phosphate cytidylyltransferase